MYRAIKKAILQLYPPKPQGNLARHLTTLVGLVSGILLSKSCQLPKMASKVSADVHPDSRTKQFSRVAWYIRHPAVRSILTNGKPITTRTFHNYYDVLALTLIDNL